MSAQSQKLDQVPAEEASQKLDRTNTGKDTSGQLYSRNMDVKQMIDELNQVCGVEIQEFLLHGELINPDL